MKENSPCLKNSISRVLIIGAYGNFGSFIAKELACETNLQLILAGRNLAKSHALSKRIKAINQPEIYQVDINKGFGYFLKKVKPNIVIHTCGPYQGQDYSIANSCINQGCHYLDLADARDFVANIGCLDANAKRKGLLICSGASSVPCLTAAIVDQYKDQFSLLESLDYAIATAQLTNRGLATVKAVLSYAGKAFTTLKDGKVQSVFGWQGLFWRRFWQLNCRPLCHCDIADLALFPERYPQLKNLEFRAGLELKFLHLGLVALAWMVRIRLLKSVQGLAGTLLNISYLFDHFGNNDSGFYMCMSGKDKRGKPKKLVFDLVAKNGDGLCIPCVPAIVMTKKIANGKIKKRGAMPCLDFVSLREYLDVLDEFAISWRLSEQD